MIFINSKLNNGIKKGGLNKMASAIVIGDQHFQINNIEEVELFIEKITHVVKTKKPDFIVCLGDLLHTHERLHTIPMNKALEFIDIMRQMAPVYSIIGNHDMTCHHNFLSENHWQNSLKKWDNVTVVDTVVLRVINGLKFVFTPYVYPGRFQEALNTIGRKWKDADCIFAHQEFYGCKMGAIISEDGDKWSLKNPNVISGHIHSRQRPQDNIYYTGSAMQHAFGESVQNTIAFVKFKKNDLYDLEEIDLKLPRKKIIYKNFENITDFEIPETQDKIKISLKGTYSEFKNFKKSKLYKQMIKKGIKVVYTCDTENKTEEYDNMKTLSFKDVLKKLIDEEKNVEIQKMYDDIIKF